MTAQPSSALNLKAPADDGQVLIWPAPQTILQLTRANLQNLSRSQVLLANVPLAQVRQAQRKWVGHDNDTQPLLANGHQIELYHPGVWAKDLLINELSAKTGGQAYHFAIDTDAPKHLQLRWPGGSEPVTDDARLTQADWAGVLDAPTPHHLALIEGEFSASASDWTFEPLALRVLGSMRRLTLESSNLTWVLTNAIHQLDWELGLRHHAMLVSPIWMSMPYLLLTHHILANAPRFAAVYNRVLAAFRRENMIRNAGRPWPDLRSDESRLEIPFWLDSLETGQRERAAVDIAGDQVRLLHGKEALELQPAADGWTSAERLARFLNDHLLRLSPRALTLTLFFRLLLADQFIHGIGGGRYDQVTDRVISEFFGLEAPAFAVTTATLLFPAAAGKQRIHLGALALEGRRIRHGWAEPAKREMARRIRELPRGSDQRRKLFFDMHAMLDNRAKGPEYAAWEDRMRQAQGQGASQRELFDRELFFAIQPAARLKMLIERYHAFFT